ncbi:RNA ligase DRB0094 family [Apiospora arundinis]|uniref:RNA ligase DRB0094 family n=1 Tax=Apiospora arundinis TaxID=335852 RepID=A0ABR2J7V8_9PEZI
MSRHLVSVRKISGLRPLSISESQQSLIPELQQLSIAEFQPLPGSHLLLANVDGWTCAMAQGTANVGDYILYFEIDSFLPAGDIRFASLGKSNTLNGSPIMFKGRYGFHVKSVKLHGTSVSQGLILPLNLFPEVTNVIAKLGKTKEAMQKVMDMPFEHHLNVQKWKPDHGGPKSKTTENSLGKVPSFFPHTDITRVQKCPNLFTNKYKDAVYQESVKLDGSAATIYFVCRGTAWYNSLHPLDGRADMPKGRFGVCSKQCDLPDKPDCLFWKAALYYRLPQKLAALGKNLAISGELCGASIGQNREGFAANKHDFFVYRIYDVDARKALDLRETELRARQLGLKHVPVNGYFRLHDIAKSHEELLKRAEGVGMFGHPREGLVYKNVEDGRSFKVISNSYLLRYGE